MRPKETRMAIAAQRAREYEAFSRYARAERLSALHDAIDRPLGTAALQHSTLDDATLIAQSFVIPGLGVHPETPRYARTEIALSSKSHSREFGTAALMAAQHLPDESEALRIQALQYAISNNEFGEQQARKLAA